MSGQASLVSIFPAHGKGIARRPFSLFDASSFPRFAGNAVDDHPHGRPVRDLGYVLHKHPSRAEESYSTYHSETLIAAARIALGIEGLEPCVRVWTPLPCA